MTSQIASSRGLNGLRIPAIVLVAVVYFAAAKFGFSLAFATQQVTAIWPPTGIALVALLILGNGAWPGVLLGAFLANVVTNESVITASAISLGNTLEALAGSLLLRRYVAFDRSLQDVRSVLGLIGFAALLSTSSSATLGVLALCASGLAPWGAFASVWRVWWVGDAMGDIVVAPFLLTWIGDPRVRWRGARLVEFAGLFISLLAVIHLVFSRRLAGAAAYSELYATFPFLIWAALRFGQRETVSAALLMSGVAIWWSVRDRGPFAHGTLDERFVLLGTFVGVIGVTALLLGAATAERRRSEEGLQKAHGELEARVHERTAELARANTDLIEVNDQLKERTDELAKKNEEVEAFVYIVSHDLRGPLVNLQGFAGELASSCKALRVHLNGVAVPAETEVAIRAIVDDDIPGALHFIGASTTKFQKLIESLLVLSRSGRQEYASEEVDVRSVVATTVDSLQQIIVGSGARVSIQSLPPARGDAGAIGQVFANLIGNAVKYLEPGRAGRIEVGGETKDGMAHYWVKDNGSGIPKSAEPRLFQVFQRFHPAVAQGEGMGLAIVKRAVERHGGQISAASEEGIGTTFHLTLPAADAKGG